MVNDNSLWLAALNHTHKLVHIHVVADINRGNLIILPACQDELPCVRKPWNLRRRNNTDTAIAVNINKLSRILHQSFSKRKRNRLHPDITRIPCFPDKFNSALRLPERIRAKGNIFITRVFNRFPETLNIILKMALRVRRVAIICLGNKHIAFR
jgi:hypothetical protein